MTLTPLLIAAAVLATGDDAVARVNGTTITSTALARRLRAASSQAGRASPDAVVGFLVDEVLLAAEGRRLGLGASDGVKARIAAETRRAAAEVFVDTEFVARAAPDDRQLRALFHSSADFARFESATFATMEDAAVAMERIRRGSTFAAEAGRAVVSKLHPDPARAPSLMRAQIEEPLASAIFGATPGSVVGPAKGATGVTIARVLGTAIGTDEAFAERREALLTHARKRLAEQMRRQLIEHVREKAKVQVDEAFLRGLQGTAATTEQLGHVVAVVNGRPILYRDIHETVVAFGSGGGHVAGGGVKIQLAWRAVETRILEDVAAERGWERRPEVVALGPEIERAALAAAAGEAIRRAVPAPGEDEIHTFYRRYEDRFGRPFSEILGEVASRAWDAKRDAAVAERLAELRKRASISIDRSAVARAAASAA